ncbi:MAG: hypothetical protein DRN49_07295, partial [Thaumarchaeota archaeon]
LSYQSPPASPCVSPPLRKGSCKQREDKIFKNSEQVISVEVSKIFIRMTLTFCILLLTISVATSAQFNPNDVCKVTLITGDTVNVLNCSGKRLYVVNATVEREFQVLKTPGGTYIIPVNVDLGKFDLELFNVDYLIDEGYYKLNHIPVLISLNKRVSKIGVLSEIKSIKGLSISKIFSKINTISAKIKKGCDVFTSLKHDSTIKKVWLDKKFHVSLSESARIINASALWKLGYNGSRIKIAILDTGIDSTHPDLDDLDDDPSTNDSKVIVAIDFTDDGSVMDFNGHGTHVASIAAGTGEASNYTYVGIAPKAYLWNVKVLNREGWGYESWIIKGIEFAAYGPDGYPNTGDEADILSLSLGGEPTDGDDPLSQAVNEAVEAGRVVIVAAGNEGEYFSISTPGAADRAITVGATDKNDDLAYFSSKGPTLDFRIKPDVLAPGVGIVAARATNTEIGTPIDEYYTSASGTSMATPHVAGGAALLLQKGVPSGWLRQTYVKDVLVSTAKDLNLNVYEQGGGRVDLLKALSTDILVDPAVINFNLNDKSSAVIRFFNLNSTYKVLNLTVELTDIFGNPSNAVHINDTTLIIPPNSSSSVLLAINVSEIKKNIYSGKIKIKVNNSKELKVIFGFSRLNKVTINKMKMDGGPAAGEYILIFNNSWYWISSTNESGTAVAYVPDGYYNVWSGGKYGESWVWTIKENVPIFNDTLITLDERETVPIHFDVGKPNQIIAALYTGLSYNKYNLTYISWTYISEYPENTTTYITPANCKVYHSYEFYPQEYYNPLNDSYIDASEWYHVFFSEDGVSSPIYYTVNYSKLANRTSYYFSFVPENVFKAEWSSDGNATQLITFGWVI